MSSNLINRLGPFEADLQAAFERNVRDALSEDIGAGDLTGLLVPAYEQVTAHVVVREAAVLCGAPWFDAVMAACAESVQIDWQYAEGALMQADSVVCKITAPARALLTAERAALNFLQMLSAVASATSHYVGLVAGTKAAILDTRKTMPGLRLAQKYAVLAGGGQNQRLALYDGILIKENHIAAAGGVAAAMAHALALRAGVSIQIEVENLAELALALEAGATSVLLDNFDLAQMREAVAFTAGRAVLEASGGVDQSSVRAIAETGVDRISIGSLTKDVRAIDYSLRII
ncbi:MULTISPECIES: carboxylating nicotinate-nucleotide diphosphorylase [unclassified Undibacterium]|uniref:carboxylating nicotinate-nucleotide diphosphorylase n=1 Tax=unclassified Undibacterium TaxID=2630295 RepID=UPI002AC8EF6B|nr:MULTISPECIES: carboxylating nicotinate-nucleotide diphosphorylase [unclassified Undibacterium]MEB0139330.1 carboxylating nicotinate-nucleotide diphosphorylase [Undibacterium sp. CCC2.1]MEB0172174.1 carboxylating nicotinate-nucleotide diphosphorylase [Undibacterium sp. CCC1.1]MEB0176035.1 carboxylating nicotinate-nucleotide diphosphorylase [Undibacterium sp. CCC3.4]MEB0215347.1 carboxylating nicotinate-nucleotide diphosphorylase [Undibacterium sp. 5I2]WPX43422.1 carboxylating nicotinate-nucl